MPFEMTFHGLHNILNHLMAFTFSVSPTVTLALPTSQFIVMPALMEWVSGTHHLTLASMPPFQETQTSPQYFILKLSVSSVPYGMSNTDDRVQIISAMKYMNYYLFMILH